MYLLIAWVWFLFAARCAFFYLLFISGFVAAFFCFFCFFFFVVNSFVVQEIAKHMHKTRLKLRNRTGAGGRKGQAEQKRNAKCDSPHALYGRTVSSKCECVCVCSGILNWATAWEKLNHHVNKKSTERIKPQI